MKNLLLIYPHWPPSNLAGVHRGRLIANFAHDFGWKVTVITVQEAFYEETPDPEIEKLVSPNIEVHKVAAYPVLKLLNVRLVGDIGLRGWLQMRKRMLDLLSSRSFDFVWIPIPSWYTSLLGRVAWRKHGIPFGIDYIDPWVYQLTKYEHRFSRQWFTRQVALLLEPLAIRKAKLITGVSEEYFMPAIKRVFNASTEPDCAAMPYGFDPNDHLVEPEILEQPWNDDLEYYLYAGAFLPHSEVFIRSLFAGLNTFVNRGLTPENVRFRFVGTGIRAGKSIADLAEEYEVEHLVEEYPERISFLSVQSLLRKSKGILIIGSTESHYTASKTFQCLLSGRPTFAIFHHQSSAAAFMEEANAANYLVKWQPDDTMEFDASVETRLQQFLAESSIQWQPDLSQLEPHSSRESARILFESIARVLES